MRIGKILIGILTAMGAGAILGILFAPDKGSVTRRKFVKKTNDLGEELNDKFNDVVETVNKKMDTLKEETSRMAAELKKRTEKITPEFEHTEKARMN